MKLSRLLARLRKRPPTDFEVLREIYRVHRDGYMKGAEGAGRESDVHVPIDIPVVASRLGMNVHSLFGRLYYHLQPIYGEEEATGGRARKAFFLQQVGKDTKNSVNFPHLEAVLAQLWLERRRSSWAVGIATLSLVVSVVSIVISTLT